MKTPMDDAVAKLVDLAREGFSRGWDRLDRADKHDEIAAAIGGIHAEWLTLVDERDTLKAEVATMKRGYVDLHQMLSEPRNADVWTKVAALQAALAASQQETERLRRVIEDAAPMMMTVTAFGADEADKNGLAEMARWYVEQERDYSSFDVWLDAYRDREKRNKEGGMDP